MSYKKRLTAPSKTNKYYLHTSSGGVNSCIHISGGSVLPNCVGYAWGRAYELMGKAPKLSRGNAENWWDNADGYKRSQTPGVGSIICWRKGKAFNENDGAGHVGVVEEVNGDSITISQSAYGGTRFYITKMKKPYSLGGSYVFQGFIYLPISVEEPKPSKPTSYKFKVGNKVTINGNLYASSNASKPNGAVKNKVTKITRLAKGTKHPYNTSGDLGWMDEKDIKLYTSKPSTKPKVGDKVKVIKAINYDTGKPFGLYYDKYDLLELSGNRAVIGIGKTVTSAIHINNIKKA